MRYIVKIDRRVREVSKKICKYVRYEWYAFPLGRVRVMGNQYIFLVEDLYVPLQEASATHVEIPSDINVLTVKVLDELRLVDPGIYLLGMWHSHGDLPVFHSSEDHSNVERIFQCFLSYLPSIYIGEEILGLFGSRDFNVEPIIKDNEFGGLRLSFGVATIEISFRKMIKNPDFFARWYKHFYDIRCLFEVLREYYKTEPIVKNLVKKKAYHVASVVVNNRGESTCEVFIFEQAQDRIMRRSEKAKMEVIDLGKKPYFLSKMTMGDILNRIRSVIQAGELTSI